MAGETQRDIASFLEKDKLATGSDSLLRLIKRFSKTLLVNC
jgi:hypothetical protein